jgi:hypothetical protein
MRGAGGGRGRPAAESVGEHGAVELGGGGAEIVVPGGGASGAGAEREGARPPGGEGGGVFARRVEGRRGCVESWNRMLQVLAQSPRGQQAFVGLALVQLVVLLAERCFVLAVAEERGLDRVVPVWFLFIVLVSSVFMLYYALRAVVYSNYAMFRVFLVAAALLLARIVAEFASRSRGETVCTGGSEAGCLAFLVLDVLIFLAEVGLSWVLMTELTWKRYKALGSSPKLQAAYGRWEMFSSTLLLDLQLSLVVLITGLAFFQLSSPVQFGINLFLILIEVAWHHHGWTGARLASWELMCIFWILSIFLPLFLVSVTIDVASNTLPLLAGQDPAVLAIVAFVAATALLNRIVTVVLSVLIYRDFGPDWDQVRAILNRGVDPFRKGRLRQRDAMRHAPAPTGADGRRPPIADWSDSAGTPIFSGTAAQPPADADAAGASGAAAVVATPNPLSALPQVLGSLHDVGLGPPQAHDDGAQAEEDDARAHAALVPPHSPPPQPSDRRDSDDD